MGENSLPIKESQPTKPISDYGKSKLLSTRIALNWSNKDRHITVARPFNLLGPGISKSLAIGNFFTNYFTRVREKYYLELAISKLIEIS